MRKPQLLTAGSLVLGLLGAALVMTYVKGVATRADDGAQTTTVLVAKQAIPAGTPVDAVAGMTETREIPVTYARPGAVTSLDALEGQVTVEPMEPGETMAARDFAAAGGTGGHLPIPAGKEAVAVAAQVDSGVAKWPVPSDRVNVYATFKDGGGASRTVRVLSDITVLATDPSGGAEAAGATLIYLLAVNPDEASRLIHAKQIGSIWLSLVPDGQASAPAPVVEGVL